MHTKAYLRAALALALAAAGCSRQDGSDTRPAPEGPAAAPPEPPRPGAPPGDVGRPPSDAELRASGVAVKVVKPGTGELSAGEFDRILVNYSTWLADGKLYFSTQTRHAPTSFDMPQLSPGLRDGMTGMRKGEVRRLWIPAAIARANERSPRGPVLTEVEVLKIAKGTAPLPAPSDVGEAPPDAAQLPDGVRYRVLVPPSGDRVPDIHDRITVRMTSWDSSGKMLESSARHGGTDTMVAGQAPPGVVLALAEMKTGEKRRVWVPLEVARQRPSQHALPLVYEVELLEVLDMPEPPDPPKQLTAPKRGVKRTESGIAYRVLKKGRGTETPPTPNTKVSLLISGWTTDGKLIASTVMNDRAYTEHVRSMIPGLQEMVASMVIGEKRLLWIPAELAFKGQPSKPQGDVIYEVEVIGIH